MPLTSACMPVLLTATLLAAGVGPVEAGSARSFFAPQYDGQLVAFCLEESEQCGRATATIWCQMKGYDEVLNYRRKRFSSEMELRFVDSGNLCKSTDCIGFSQIKCMTMRD
jgi:hypothetical protein